MVGYPKKTIILNIKMTRADKEYIIKKSKNNKQKMKKRKIRQKDKNNESLRDEIKPSSPENS